jgi:DNA-binding NtrC family response regulator
LNNLHNESPQKKPPMLLSLIELGGYPDFTPLYQREGFTVTAANSTRKAISLIKKNTPDVIVAEFNYQSDFRDRTSSLESLLASVERFPHTRAIVFYEIQTRHQLDKLLQQFDVFRVMAYPIEEAALAAVLRDARDAA